MNVRYIEPLRISYEKMKYALFKPIIAKNWFIIGFTAWLAYLLENFNSINFGKRLSIEDYDLPPISSINNLIKKLLSFISEHIYLFYLIVFAIILAIGLLIIINWLSSRGKFMFLYNVIEQKAEIKQPWEKFRELGNSLFLWRLIFGIICFIAFLIICIPLFHFILKVIQKDSFPFEYLPPIIILALMLFAAAIIIILINLYLNDFVVPIMYFNNIRANNAWRKFLTIFSNKFGWFLLYALYISGLSICVIIFLIIFSIITCCIGLILLIIPYVSSVLLLPITYTYRLLSIEFLSQFDNEIYILTHSRE